MSYKITSIDVHKRILALVTSDVTAEGEFQFDRRKLSTSPDQLRALAEWLDSEQVEEVVMESTAQYWRPVWAALERYWQPKRRQREGAGPKAGSLYLAQAKSNRGPRGRKNDFLDAERLLRRLVAGELVLSFVPDPEQRLWRTVTHRRQQLLEDRVRLQNQMEALLEQAHIKLSSLVSDLLGASARRMLRALADGETDPAALAALADRRLRASAEELADALGAALELHPVYRRMLAGMLEELQLLESHIAQLDREIAGLLEPHQQAVQRLAEVPGLGVDSAHQIIAEVGPAAASFPSAKQLSSWVGVCPGEQESAEVSQSSRSPKGNRAMRRVLDQAAHAAVRTKGSIFELIFHRLLRKQEYQEAIWTIAHRLCRLVWKILHHGVHYEERGPSVGAQVQRKRTSRMIRELRKLGYRVEPTNAMA